MGGGGTVCSKVHFFNLFGCLKVQVNMHKVNDFKIIIYYYTTPVKIPYRDLDTISNQKLKKNPIFFLMLWMVNICMAILIIASSKI